MVDGPDYKLHNKVEQLGRVLVDVDQKIALVGQELISVSAQQRDTRTELQQLRSEFLEWVQQAQRTANIQRAETRIVALEANIEQQFGHHKVVRRSATGMLQAFDTGIVSDEVIRNVAEELMVQSPRYWLAPALVAMAAWSSDDQALCDKAITEAFRRSPDRTSLMFALILRRQTRYEAAARWLRHYLRAQTPTALGRDFAVILEAISQGAFGAAGLDLVQETLAEWRRTLLRDDAVQAAQVRLWRAEVDSFVAAPVTDLPNLAAVSPQWAGLDQCLRHAQAHARIREKYAAMMDEELSTSDRIEDAVDDILDRLVSEYDREELPLKRELDTERAIVELGGDLGAARARVTGTVAFEETLDYLTIQSTSALRPADIGVSRATQRLSVAACSTWFGEAHGSYTLEYRSRLPVEVEAAFETSHNVGAQAFKLPRWVGKFSQPLPQLEADLSRHWDEHRKKVVATFAYDWQKNAIIAGVVSLVALIVFVAGGAYAAGVVLGLLIGGIWGAVIYMRHAAALKSAEQADAVMRQGQATSLAQLREAAAQLTDWSQRYRAADQEEAATRAMIDSFSTSQHIDVDFAGRTVLETREI